MEKITYTCDKCGKEITDVVYSLTCYAKDVAKGIYMSEEVQIQNTHQNYSDTKQKHLCRECKDKITDGVFIV